LDSFWAPDELRVPPVIKLERQGDYVCGAFHSLNFICDLASGLQYIARLGGGYTKGFEGLGLTAAHNNGGQKHGESDQPSIGLTLQIHGNHFAERRLLQFDLRTAKRFIPSGPA